MSRLSLRILAPLALLAASCRSPEDGRPRGGGPGADGGNYAARPVHAPSKIDATRPIGVNTHVHP